MSERLFEGFWLVVVSAVLCGWVNVFWYTEPPTVILGVSVGGCAAALSLVWRAMVGVAVPMPRTPLLSTIFRRDRWVGWPMFYLESVLWGLMCVVSSSIVVGAYLVFWRGHGSSVDPWIGVLGMLVFGTIFALVLSPLVVAAWRFVLALTRSKAGH